MASVTFAFRRICIIGTTGSGKSTLAARLAERLGVDFIELDALHWEPNWTEVPLATFRQLVENATLSFAWVVDGNYHAVRDIIWPRAEAIVWLDYSFPLIFWRLWSRTWRRVIQQEILWNGNRETLWPQFFTKDSLFLWMIRTYGRRKREFPFLFARPEHAHLKIVHFRTPHQAERWLETL